MFDWLWPRVCVACREPCGTGFCPRCAPGSVLRPPRSALGVDQVFCLDRFERPAGQALRKAKLSSDPTRLVGLGRAFATAMRPVLHGAAFDAVVPAPSMRRTRMQRGFAAGAILAGCVADQLGVPLVHALSTRDGRKLAGLDAPSRRRALEGRIRSTRDVAGHVLLVDDVLTTGATAEACALELIGGCTDRVTLATFCVVSRPSLQARG